MEKHEKILLVLGALLIVAVLIWDYKPADDVPHLTLNNQNPPQNQAWNKWKFLTYNQPYLFAPPVANILPATAIGILGIKYTPDPQNYDGTLADCGC